jgi:hypothetical protein
MVHRHLEDLSEEIEVHVDRPGRQRSRAAAIAPAKAIDIGDHHRCSVLRSCRDLGRLADLLLAVAVDFRHRDLGELVVLEERKQMVREVVAVMVRGVLLDLEMLRGEPVGGELVERWINSLDRHGVLAWRAPNAEVDVAQDDRELALRHRSRPAVLRPSQCQVLAFAISGKAKPESGLAFCRLDYLPSCGSPHRLPDRVYGCPHRMDARSAQTAPTTFGPGAYLARSPNWRERPARTGSSWRCGW